MKKIIATVGIILGVAIALVYFYTNYSIVVVDGQSMYPTLKDGDLCILRNTQDVKFGDIIAIKHDQMLCKRVIGVEGDGILIVDGLLYLNDSLLEEPYIYQQDWFGEACLYVDEDSVYILGDNRNDSYDSRQFGCLTTDRIKGVVVFNVSEKTGLSSEAIYWFLRFLWIALVISAIVDKIREKKAKV